jgi:serine/threonine protein kinase
MHRAASGVSAAPECTAFAAAGTPVALLRGRVANNLTRAERSLVPGDRLDRYEIVGTLALGGMAEIHLARAATPGDSSLVVIKRLHPHLASHSDMVRMFIDEATISARLDHVHIGKVERVAEHAGVLFLVMEFIDGESLHVVFRDQLKRCRSFPVRFALHLVAQIARGLDYAHRLCDQRGRPLAIVHRDISMSNIMVGFDGSPKLIDFGIAKSAHRITESMSGIRKGKARWMSPEQVLGRHVDRRSDVFALGILLHELTTFRPLFAGSDSLDCMRRVVEQPIPRPGRGALPTALEAAILRALARDPARRYGSAGELADALERLAHEHALQTASAEIAVMMSALYPEERRAHHPMGSSRDGRGPTPGPAPHEWCPDTGEVSAFLDRAIPQH